jgi:hypothetical protein
MVNTRYGRFTPAKDLPERNDLEVGTAAELVGTFIRREIFVGPAGVRVPEPLFLS